MYLSTSIIMEKTLIFLIKNSKQMINTASLDTSFGNISKGLKTQLIW